MPYKAFTISGIGDITVYKRRTNRTIRLTVDSEGSVRVTMPLWVPYNAGVAFASSRRTWILAQTQIHKKASVLRESQQIGKSHHLRFHSIPFPHKVTSSIRGTEIHITYGTGYSDESAEVQKVARKASVRALRTQASILLLQRLEQLAKKNGYLYRSSAVKQLRSRWGSCDQNANIILNLYLVQLPWELIDYVILHELAHTKALHHGSQFWHTLELLHPDARKLRKKMRNYRPTLIMNN